MDIFLTRLIYQLPHTNVSDAVFRIFSFLGPFAFLWLFIFGLLFLKTYQKSRLLLLKFFMSASITFVFVDHFLKPLFHRPRPFANGGILPQYSAPANYPHDFSFPSLHSALAFNLAFQFSLLFPKYKIIFYSVACCIAFSRVYLGYHYALDIIMGAIIGILCGLITNFQWPYETQRTATSVSRRK